MKRKVFLVLIVYLSVIFVSAALAASTFKRVSANPFYRPPLASEADLGTLVKTQDTQIRTGFAKAGYRNLYMAFSEQFPSAAIDSIKVSPGETFKWMLFKKKGTGPVIVTKDVTWKGAGPLDAYRFYIGMKGKRYEFVVLHACGNLALRNVTKTPLGKTPATSGKASPTTQSPQPSASDKAVVGTGASSSLLPATSGKEAAGTAGVMSGAPDGAAAGTAKAMPGASDKVASGPAGAMTGDSDKAATGPAGAMAGASEKAAAGPAGAMPGASDSTAAGSSISTPSASEKAATAGTAAPMPGASDRGAAASAITTSTAEFLHNTIVDVGFSYQKDPASYLFVRMGYEFPLVDKLSLIASLGGYFRIHGYDGGSAVIADAILDYHWWNRLSFGLGAGYWWTRDEGQMDLIANLGILVYGKPDSFNSTLFLEARSEVNEMDNLHNLGRFGLGIRFRF
jgi:hypothetical protein